jgi:hypothetical protein
MRTFAAAIGLIGVLVSQAAMGQEAAPGGAPPAAGDPGVPAATTPPPVETTPPPGVATTSARGSQLFGAAAGPGGPSVWGILPWGGFGAGVRYMIPVPITQLLSRTKFRDYWVIEFGGDILRYSYDYGFGTTGYSYSWTEIIPVAGMMWQVWFTENFAAYPKVEAGYAFGWYSNTQGGSTGLSGGNHFYPGATAGVLYKLNSGITLRAEAGYVGAKLGVGWLF